MLYAKQNRFQWTKELYSTTMANTAGTSVTPGASNVVGAWTALIATGVMVNDSYLLALSPHSGSTSTVSKMHILDVGLDPAGGTAFVSIFGNTEVAGEAIEKGFICGSSVAGLTPYRLNIPMRIPAGWSVGVRVQGSAATAGTIKVLYQLFGRPTVPEEVWTGGKFHTIGAIDAASLGVSVIPGWNAEGTWTEIGTAPANLRSISPGWQIDNTAIPSASVFRVEVGYGDATNKVSLANYHGLFITTEYFVLHQVSDYHVTCNIPAGASLYGRIYSASTEANCPTGWNMSIVGVS